MHNCFNIQFQLDLVFGDLLKVKGRSLSTSSPLEDLSTRGSKVCYLCELTPLQLSCSYWYCFSHLCHIVLSIGIRWFVKEICIYYVPLLCSCHRVSWRFMLTFWSIGMIGFQLLSSLEWVLHSLLSPILKS